MEKFKKFAEYTAPDGTKRLVYQKHDGKFYIYNDEGITPAGFCFGGGYGTLIEAEKMLTRLCPKARKIDLEPSKDEIIGWLAENLTNKQRENFLEAFPYYRTYSPYF